MSDIVLYQQWLDRAGQFGIFYDAAQALWDYYGPRVIAWGQERAERTARYLANQRGNPGILGRRGLEPPEFEPPTQWRRIEGRVEDSAYEGPGVAASVAMSDRTMEDYNQNPQFIAEVRNSYSKYGRPRRRNLRNLWREDDKGTNTVWARQQSFSTDGWPTGIGPAKAVYGTANATYDTMPFFMWDVTSFPAASYYNQTLSLQETARPVMCYQLKRNKVAGDYYFDAINSAYLANGGEHNLPVWTKTKQRSTGSNPVIVDSWRHKYARLKLTMYPSASSPVKWNIALIKFPQWPKQVGIPYNQYYNETNTARLDSLKSYDNVEFFSGITKQWDKFFSGKLLHPNAEDKIMQDPDMPVLPFSILKKEEMYQPSESVTSTVPVRLLKTFYFHNDREYRSALDYNLTATSGPGDGYQFPIQTAVSQQVCSPWAPPADRVYIAVWCESFITVSNADPPTAASLPQFDWVIESKWSWKSPNLRSVGNPAPPALLVGVPEEPVVDPGGSVDPGVVAIDPPIG